MKKEDKCETVTSLLNFAKNSKLNINQKKKILNLIQNLEDATDKQKNRFISYYGLDNNSSNLKNFTQIAQESCCTPSAVRCSVVSIRLKLKRLGNEFKVIENIVHECEKIAL